MWQPRPEKKIHKANKRKSTICKYKHEDRSTFATTRRNFFFFLVSRMLTCILFEHNCNPCTDSPLLQRQASALTETGKKYISLFNKYL